MIKVLFPRFPFTEQEFKELLEKKREEFYKRKFHTDDQQLLEKETLAFYQDFEQKYPKYRLYVRWRGRADGIKWIYGLDNVYESEYLVDSKEWEEYSELKHQLIDEQKIPFDSPEWQAVIEKYRRKDDKTECETNTDLGKAECEAIRELSEEKKEDENPNDTPPTHGITKQEVQEALDEFHRHTIVNPNKTLFLSHLPDGSLEVKDGDKVVARVERIESGEFNVEYFESEE